MPCLGLDEEDTQPIGMWGRNRQCEGDTSKAKQCKYLKIFLLKIMTSGLIKSRGHDFMEIGMKIKSVLLEKGGIAFAKGFYKCSTFNGTHGKTLHQILLTEEIDDHNRNQGQEITRQLVCRLRSCPRDQVTKHDHQGLFLIRGQVNQRRH